MHNNLNWQILRGAAGISVNMCVFSDANVVGMFIFLSQCFKLTINVNINAYCVSNMKKTNVSCICQKSELNSQEIGVFWWYFDNSSDHFEENGSQKDTPIFFCSIAKKS